MAKKGWLKTNEPCGGFDDFSNIDEYIDYNDCTQSYIDFEEGFMIQIIIITRIDCKNATNSPNWTFLVSIERRESQLSNDGNMINFGSIRRKLQRN